MKLFMNTVFNNFVRILARLSMGFSAFYNAAHFYPLLNQAAENNQFMPFLCSLFYLAIMILSVVLLLKDPEEYLPFLNRD